MELLKHARQLKLGQIFCVLATLFAVKSCNFAKQAEEQNMVLKDYFCSFYNKNEMYKYYRIKIANNTLYFLPYYAPSGLVLNNMYTLTIQNRKKGQIQITCHLK